MLGCVFVLGSSDNWRFTFGFLIIRGGICVMMLLYTFARKIVDSFRIGSIRRPNGLIVLSFCSNCCLYLLCKMQSYAGSDGHDFSLMLYWRANFSLPSCRGASCASVYRLSITEVLNALKASLRPSW